jgi:ubiquinone biosynthesis protein
MLASLRHCWRIIRIGRILAHNNALFPFELVPQARPFLGLARPFVNTRAPGRPGQRLAAALEQMGPTFIKFGQSLATRTDLLGEAIATDLATLQDRLPSFPLPAAKAAIEEDLEQPLDALFTDFAEKPVAAASIAQVHFAKTTDGREVAVKVLRPGIEQAIEEDLVFFTWLARLVERTQPQLAHYRPVEAVAMFATGTRRELDLRLEAAAAVELAENSADYEGFRVPEVDWRRTGRRVLTLERIVGEHVSGRARVIAAGHNPDVIMENASKAFFNQVFRDGFFHGDMHPGNFMIDAEGTIVALDFGIMGRVEMADRRHMAEILVGFLERDYLKVADVFFKAGFLPPEADRMGFVQAVRSIGEPILGLPLEEISFGRLVGQLLAVADNFEMRTQPQLLLLQKTMVVAEGVGRLLNPKVNMWQLAQPLVEDWIVTNLGPRARLEQFVGDGLDTAGRLPGLVRRLEDALDREREAAAVVVKGRLRGGQAGWLGGWLVPLLVGLLIGLALG